MWKKKISEAKNDSKKIWNVLNNLCGKTKKNQTNTIEYIKNNEDVIFTEEQDIVDQFNIYFSTVGTNLAQRIANNSKSTFKEEKCQKTIFLEPTTITEVKNTITNLKNNCAPGEDKITKHDLIILFEIIGNIIVTLMNNILSTGNFPEELKVAKITPIFKKGSRSEFGNYRPISVLNTFSKIVEKIIKSRLIGFVEKNFKFDKYQYGFQTKSNTLSTTSDLIEYISTELDKNKYVLCVFIDLQKAFDTVNIDILLEKLNQMGIRGVAQSLMETYSKKRKHFTVINKSKSSDTELNVGVAQGSVLGPIQYLLYVHSLQFLGLNARYYKFADDTVLVFSDSNSKNLETLVNSNLRLYYSWLCNNKLSINVTKTVYMIISQKNKPKCVIDVYLNDVKLKEVSEYKYLGLILTNQLSWDAHIESIIKKIVPMVGAIRRCREILNFKSRTMLYNSFILPHLRYLIPCWGNAPEYQIDKIQRAQNKAIKTIFQFEYFTPTQEVFRRTSLLDIKKLRTFEQVKFIYNIQNKLIKTNLEVQTVGNCHNYNVRSADLLRNQHVRTAKAQNSPLYRCIESFNEMPQSVTDVRTMKKLCHTLKSVLLQ